MLLRKNWLHFLYFVFFLIWEEKSDNIYFSLRLWAVIRITIHWAAILKAEMGNSSGILESWSWDCKSISNTTLMAENEEELKSLLMKEKEESEKVGLKFSLRELKLWHLVPSVQFSSVTQSCLTLCNPMNCNTPGLPVHHQLPEFTQTHIHWVGDAIQSSHPLSSPSPPAPNSSQHQCLFQWVNSSHEVAKVLEFQL